MSRSNRTPTLLKDYQPPRFFIKKVSLNIEIHAEKTLVRSKLEFSVNKFFSKENSRLVLNGVSLILKEIYLGGSQLGEDAYNYENDELTIFNVPESCILETLVEIDPRHNSTLSGLYFSKRGYFTQCEAEGFRRITFFLDRPDVMAQFVTTISADREHFPVLLSNGNLVGTGQVGRTHWATWEDPFPKPCYLFAMVAANLSKIQDNFTTMSGRRISLKIYVESGRTKQCKFAMSALKTAMKWDEEKFGLEVDLDQYSIVAVEDFNMGAMENKGLNIFNSKYILAEPDLSTDRDYMFIDRVIAHEYFHNWTGNRVTCRDWFQLSLKEGLTVFRDQEYGADRYSRATQRIQEVRNLRAVQFPEDASPMAHAVRPKSYFEINNFYTATVYEKGAELVRMLHTLVGVENFRKGMDLYFKRHDGCAVTTDDFVDSIADACGSDLTQFKLWYDRPGTPVVSAESEYDPISKTFEIKLEQSLPGYDFSTHTPFHIPIAVGLIDPEGNDLNTSLIDQNEVKTTHILAMKKKKEIFTFKNIPVKPTLSLLRNFSAPVSLQFPYDANALTHQMSHDTDTFNRWEASQILATKVILDNAERIKSGLSQKYPEHFLNAIENILANSRQDPAFTAEVISLPSELFLAEKMSTVDPENLNLSRVSLIKKIAKMYKNSILEIYKSNSAIEPYKPDPAATGRRSLKNICLQYLMELGEHSIQSICIDQFKNSDNMTDTIASLSAMVNTDCDKKNWALKIFYDRWNQEPSAVDKWLSVQAASRSPETLAIVKLLTQHEAFDYTNPNKVYSLLRTFSVNHLQFHNKNGLGYKFLAEQIIILDSINPQVAARISRGFDRCQRLNAERWSLAKDALMLIYNSSSLSKDTREIVSKTLDK